MMSGSASVPPPDALAIGICDLIHRDRATSKRFILGCFSVLHADSFPVKHPALGIYLDLTNGRGKVAIRVQIVDSDGEREPIWTTELEFDFPDPRIIGEFDFMAGGLEFPEAGEYRVQVYANDDFIIERRLIVNDVSEKNE